MRPLNIQHNGVTEGLGLSGMTDGKTGSLQALSETDPSFTSPLSSPDSQPEFQYNASLHSLDTSTDPQAPSAPSMHTPITGLRIQTDQLAQKNRQDTRPNDNGPIAESPRQTVFNAGLPVRHSSIRSSHTSRRHRAGSLSPASTTSSPGVGPLVEMTPLPSPISLWNSPPQPRRSIDDEQDDTTPGAQDTHGSSESNQGAIQASQSSPKKRKVPILGKQTNNQQAQVEQADPAAHARNRSLSDYVPDGMQVPKPRHVAVSTSVAPLVGLHFSPPDDTLHREQSLAIQRGIAIAKPPTPPDSIRGGRSDELEQPSALQPNKSSLLPNYEAKSIRCGRMRRWKGLRKLGEGQFSTVMLATSQPINEDVLLDPTQAEAALDPKSLVAVKICNHGPAGGADEKSLENSIQRELDLMRSIHHPSLVHLKAVNNQDRQTLFVLNYCPGGDLFELASTRLNLLQPALVRRIFAELVDAVRCLHLQYMVHRDIKLESMFPIL